jgi:trans-aconitate 2-methyltransferase
MATSWDPTLYLAYDDHRSRPFHDLLARIGATSPRRVVDVGCGPGHLTALLAARWPEARIEAFDSSPDMVEAALSRGIDARQADVVDWVPEPDTDVVVTNAVLQWVPGHQRLLTRWASALPAGGWLAMQVPGNFGAASHTLAREVVASRSRWRDAVTLRDDQAVGDPAAYAQLLTDAGTRVDAWETTYQQRLTGEDPVLAWMSGTALRPVADALDANDYAEFRTVLAGRLREAYPTTPDGATWFPFRRIFVVAHKTA